MPWDLTGNSGTNPETSFLGTQDSQPLVIRTNNSEKVRVMSDGQVGIGTTNPRSRLQIGSMTAIDEGVSAVGAWANIGSNAYFDGTWKRIDSTKAAVNLHMNPSDSRGQELRLQRWEADGTRQRNIAVIGSSTSFIAEGNVGIGMTNPAVRLYVDGAVRSSGREGGSLQAFNPNNQAASVSLSWENNVARIRVGGTGFGPANGLDIQGTEDRSLMRIRNDGTIEVPGDVRLTGADCAENFDVEEAQSLEPGMVMVIGDEEKVYRCTEAYDKRVAGVISGAGDYKPGMILGNVRSQNKRLPVALTGRVYCKVDTQYAPIAVGDLLTTSPSPGHAMKAADPLKAVGAVIGKALRPLRGGQGTIPILVALQ